MDNMTELSPEEIAELEKLEQEILEQEQRAQQLREYLSSFSSDTVFYNEIIVHGNVQMLGTWTKAPQSAYDNGFIDNHLTEDELTYVPNSDSCGIYYIKGHEKPAETPEEFIARRE